MRATIGNPEFPMVCKGEIRTVYNDLRRTRRSIIHYSSF